MKFTNKGYAFAFKFVALKDTLHFRTSQPKEMNRHKLLAIIFLFFILSSCSPSANEEDNAERTQPVLSAEVKIRDLSDTRTVSAPVIAYRRVYITARTAGQVLEVNFEEGDRVRKGQVLARLDTRRQEAQLRNAQARLVEARQHFNRQKTLFDEQVITAAEFENATLMLEQAESDVQFQKVEVDLGIINSPIDAVVSARLVEPGTTANTNDRLFTIEDHDLLVVRPALSELDVAQLEKGQQLDLTFDVLGEETYPGTIRRIFPAADNITRLFTVEVEIHQNEIPRVIRPGYLARTRFTLDNRKDVVAVPNEAIVRKDEKSVVWVIREEKVHPAVVETGVERDGYIEILSGLEANETVAAGNLNRLEDGMKVSVTGTFRRYGFRD